MLYSVLSYSSFVAVILRCYCDRPCCYCYKARSFSDREQIVLAILSIDPILAESLGCLALQLSIAELS
ncbi:hypothetical protein C7B77_11475 [Chamaesiphon polymorphus CCALA 037]|uniref:Uncharacterized protein n=1 Tax=Chamaesiphon polymorphus CCALA 037 TaxID=2107692 RepID=A0A2T1GG61_9CYAN|nr:hypothetical protein C7B77_11475 [Chamaesiphon polymorphus CCALA 037]